MIKVIFLTLGAIILCVAILFGLTWMGIEWTRFFEPKREDIRREVFENTKSYNQGKIQELAKHRLEYLRADDLVDRSAIASTVRLQFADFNFKDERVPSELVNFWNEVNR